MNFLCVQNNYCSNHSQNIYYKLESLMKCIKDDKQIKSFHEHREEIMELLDTIVNDNNIHMFNDLFIVYVFLRSYSLCKKEDEMAWTYLVQILKNYDTDDVNRIIFFYTAIPIFYLNNNKKFHGPDPLYFYTEWNFNYRIMFSKILKNDPENEKLLKKTEYHQSIIESTYYKVGKSKWLSMSIVLIVVTGYCMVTKDYDSYNNMIENLFDNIDEIHNKIELNGIGEKINEHKYTGDHDNVEEYIKYVLDLVSKKDNVRVIH